MKVQTNVKAGGGGLLGLNLVAVVIVDVDLFGGCRSGCNTGCRPKGC